MMFPASILLSICAACAQVNQWVEVKPAFHSTSKHPGATLGGYNGWAALKYRSKDGTVLAWRQILDERRTNGIYANGFVLWNPADNRIDLATVSNYGGGTYAPNPSFNLLPEFAADTTPAPRHPYDAFAYVESQDAAYILLGAMPRINNFEGNPDPALNGAFALDQASTWKYSFGTGKWKRIPDSIRRFWREGYCDGCVWFHDNHLLNWPAAGKLLFIDGPGRHVAEFDLQTDTWSQVATVNTAPFSLQNALSTWDSKRELAVFRNGTSVAVYDPARRTFDSLPDCGVESAASGEHRYDPITYLPELDVYFVVGRGGLTRIFDLADGVWRTLTSGSEALPGAGDGYLEYDRRSGLVVFSSGEKFATFKYMRSGTGAGKAPTPRKPTWVARAGHPHVDVGWEDATGLVRLALIGVDGEIAARIEADPGSLRMGLRWDPGNLAPGAYTVVLATAAQRHLGRLIVLP